MTPSSRSGPFSQYNMFPWKQKPHQAWHFLFLNMTIFEVWEMLDRIHFKVFNTGRERIARDWLWVCTVDTNNPQKLFGFEKDKISFMGKKENAAVLQDAWVKCFGGASLERAVSVMKYMMLFIIFGEKMADPEGKIFDDGHLERLLDRLPEAGIRRWALEECLGNCGSLSSAKTKMAAIVDKVRDSL